MVYTIGTFLIIVACVCSFVVFLKLSGLYSHQYVKTSNRYVSGVLICLLLPLGVHSQNLYKVLKSGRDGLHIQRTTVVSSKNMELAVRVISQRASSVVVHLENLERSIITAEMRQSVYRPEKIMGGYNYLKVTTKGFRTVPEWGKMAWNNGRNGAHHIVTQTVIKAIVEEENLKHIGKIKSNAPAVYSPLHSEANYKDLFHDHTRILSMYHSKGVKELVLDFFKRLNAAHKEEGLPLYPEAIIQTELDEAELWCKHWGLKWE